MRTSCATRQGPPSTSPFQPKTLQTGKRYKSMSQIIRYSGSFRPHIVRIAERRCLSPGPVSGQFLNNFWLAKSQRSVVPVSASSAIPSSCFYRSRRAIPGETPYLPTDQWSDCVPVRVTRFCKSGRADLCNAGQLLCRLFEGGNARQRSRFRYSLLTENTASSTLPFYGILIGEMAIRDSSAQIVSQLSDLAETSRQRNEIRDTSRIHRTSRRTA